MKHTPGPWEAIDSPGAGWSVRARLQAWEGRLLDFYKCPPRPSLKVEFSGDGLKLVASLGYETWCQFPASQWPEELAANMKLIAAAPDLLEACKELRDALAAAMRVVSGSEYADAWLAVCDSIGIKPGVGKRADAAIEKAEGK